jgi:hypothetical protein
VKPSALSHDWTQDRTHTRILGNIWVCEKCGMCVNLDNHLMWIGINYINPKDWDTLTCEEMLVAEIMKS